MQYTIEYSKATSRKIRGVERFRFVVICIIALLIACGWTWYRYGLQSNEMKYMAEIAATCGSGIVTLMINGSFDLQHVVVGAFAAGAAYINVFPFVKNHILLAAAFLCIDLIVAIIIYNLYIAAIDDEREKILSDLQHEEEKERARESGKQKEMFENFRKWEEQKRRSYYGQTTFHQEKPPKKEGPDPEYHEAETLYAGVKTLDELKSRYHALMKIYHPDNMAGDIEMTKRVQKEYEIAKKYMEMKASSST